MRGASRTVDCLVITAHWSIMNSVSFPQRAFLLHPAQAVHQGWGLLFCLVSQPHYLAPPLLGSSLQVWKPVPWLPYVQTPCFPIIYCPSTCFMGQVPAHAGHLARASPSAFPYSERWACIALLFAFPNKVLLGASRGVRRHVHPDVGPHCALSGPQVASPPAPRLISGVCESHLWPRLLWLH